MQDGSADDTGGYRSSKSDVDAFEELWRLHSEEIGRSLGRILINEADVLDCLQDAFLAWHCITNKQEIENKRAYLFRMAINRATQMNRTRVQRGEVSLTSILEEEMPIATPLEQVEEGERIQQVKDAMTQLPQQLADILILKVYRRLSYDDIAQSLGLTKDQVHHRLQEARARLRELLMPEEALAQHAGDDDVIVFDKIQALPPHAQMTYLDELSAKQREFMGYRLSGLSQTDAARKMSIRPSTANGHQKRALVTARGFLAKQPVTTSPAIPLVSDGEEADSPSNKEAAM